MALDTKSLKIRKIYREREDTDCLALQITTDIQRERGRGQDSALGNEEEVTLAMRRRIHTLVRILGH